MSENDYACVYCGTKNNNLAYKNLLFFIIVVLVLVFGLLLFFLKEPVAETADALAPPVPTLLPAADQNAVKDEFHEAVVTWQPHEYNSYSNIEDITEMITNIARASEIYNSLNAKTREFISKNGYLFDYTEKSYISVADYFSINEAGIKPLLKPEYTDFKVLLLYLNLSHLKVFPQLKIIQTEETEDELQIFAACETKEGFVISSAQSPGGIITREDLKGVLDKYKTDNGKTIRYLSNSPEYISILNAIKSFAKTDTEYDVRYLSADNKYAVVVVSPKGKAAQLNGYVLVKNNSSWSVNVSNFETMGHYVVRINEHLPALNTDLAPKYDLYMELKYIKTDLDPKSILKEDYGELTFSCGSRNFVNLEFKDGKSLVGCFTGNTWKFYSYNGYAEGEAIMNSFTGVYHPYYIFKQN